MDVPIIDQVRVQEQSKSTSNLLTLCQAADVRAINSSNGLYTVEFYRSTQLYSVEITDFFPDSLIRLNINYGSQSSSSIIDFGAETLSIQDEDDYIFRDLDYSAISASSSELFRVTASITGHHNEYPFASATFPDNGDQDSFPTPSNLRPFKEKKTKQVNFFPGLCYDVTTTTTFWGAFTSTHVGEAYGC